MKVPVLVIASGAEDTREIFNAVSAEFQKQVKEAEEKSGDATEFLYFEKAGKGIEGFQRIAVGSCETEKFVLEFKDLQGAKTLEVKNMVTTRPDLGNGNGQTDRYRITITEGEFGGRGHDYEVRESPPPDDKIEQNGGLMVVATAIPKER